MNLKRLCLALFLLVVSLPAFSATRTWTGANSIYWSDPGNWSPAGIPTATDSLAFNSSPAMGTATFNDLPAGTAVGPLLRLGSALTINGNALTLMGDVDTGINLTMPLTLGASVHLGDSSYTGPIDVNGQTVAIAGDVWSLNGTGSITTFWLHIHGSGNFTGPISGAVDIEGSLPNATIAGGGFGLTGNGTVGPTEIIGPIRPGPAPVFLFSDTHSIGTLQTGPLNISGKYSVDLVPGGVSDQIKVTGTVTLSGALEVTVSGGSPAPGQTITIIDNDGTDPVNGTFGSLVEGSVFTVGVYNFRISYHGGDGNDVVLTLVGGAKTWTGAVSGNWSDPNNWSPAGIPVSGDQLAFPAGAAHTAMTNDLPAGFTVGTMTFYSNYTLSGNALTLSADVASVNLSVPYFAVPLTIGTSLQLPGGSYVGPIDVN